MMELLIKFFQHWQAFTQNNPFVLIYISLLGAKVGLFGVFVVLAFFAKKMFKDAPQQVFDANWHMGSVAQVFLIFVIFQAIAVYFKNPFVGSQYQEGIESAWAIVEYFFLFALLWVVLRFALGKDLAHAGWQLADIRLDARVAFQGILLLGVMAVLTNFLYWTELLTPSSKIIEHVKISDLFSQGIFSVIQMSLVLFVSPVCEETFYRGFIYPVLRNALPRGVSIFLLSAFFAAVHLQWSYFILLFLMSWVVTLAYEKTQSLAAPVAIHVSYNLLVLLGVFTY